MTERKFMANSSIEDLILFIENEMIVNPKYFLFRENEPIVNESDIIQIKKEVGFEIPKDFQIFQEKFGGGNFGFLELFSLNKNSEYFIFKNSYGIRPKDNFLPISSDGVGGYYGFLLNDCHHIYYYDTNISPPIIEKTQWNFVDFIYFFAFKKKHN